MWQMLQRPEEGIMFNIQTLIYFYANATFIGNKRFSQSESYRNSNHVVYVWIMQETVRR
jgi:hypothetical protein